MPLAESFDLADKRPVCCYRVILHDADILDFSEFAKWIYQIGLVKAFGILPNLSGEDEEAMERDPFTAAVAANIERLLEEKGMTKSALREAAGLNQSAIHDILTGRSRSPRLETVVAIARALGVSPVDLLLPPDLAARRQNIMLMFDRLPADEQDRLVAIARALLTDE